MKRLHSSKILKVLIKSWTILMLWNRLLFKFSKLCFF